MEYTKKVPLGKTQTSKEGKKPNIWTKYGLTHTVTEAKDQGRTHSMKGRPGRLSPGVPAPPTAIWAPLVRVVWHWCLEGGAVVDPGNISLETDHPPLYKEEETPLPHTPHTTHYSFTLLTFHLSSLVFVWGVVVLPWRAQLLGEEFGEK
jgi:hypothetical protein